MKNVWQKSITGICFVSLSLSLCSVSALAQTTTPSTGLILTNTTTSNNPFLWLQDSSGNSGVFPILEVTGGVASQTLGIEITSQFNSSLTTTPPAWATIMPQGYGGLSLVQNSPATMGSGVSSPTSAMCGSQWGNNTGTYQAGPACWYWQVQGGSNSNPPDVLELFRNNYANAATDITVMFPAAINLATAPLGGMSPSAGQITVGPAPYNAANANVLATFTGASTSYGTSAHAGPAVIQAGQLTAAATSPPDANSTEGSFQIMQSYRGSLGTSQANVGLLACPDTTTTQGVVPCAVTGQAENWVGVYNNNPAQVASLATPGVTVTPTRYGRVTVNSHASASWTLGDYVCKDDTNAGYSIDNNPSGSNNVPCNGGESVGIVALTDSSATSHTIDLVPAASQQGGAMLPFFWSGIASAGNTIFMFPGAPNTNCAQTASTVVQPVSFSGTIKNLEVFYGVAPGTHDVITVLKCPAPTFTCAVTVVTCTVMSGAACSDTSHSVSISQGDGIQIQDALVAGSAGQNVRMSLQIQ